VVREGKIGAGNHFKTC
jgi:hypothetical protein